MSYVGSAPSPSQVQFSTLDAQAFNGDGSTTAFTLNRAVSIAASIEVTVNNVQQSPYDGSYTVNGTTTLTFSEAPSSGTDNIYVRFLDYPLASITPGNDTVGSAQLQSNLSLTGNLNLASTGARITGDFSNATQANRVAFQTSTTNASTTITALPNGTGTQSTINLFDNSDPTNAGTLNMLSNTSEKSLRATITGTGTYLPMTFHAGGSERMRIASAGGVHIGTTSTYGTNSKLSVFGSATAADTGIVLSDGATTTIGLALATPSTGSVPYIFGNNNLAFGSNGAERMRIDSSGNVGIGTSSPAASHKLTIKDAGNTGGIANIKFESTTAGVTNGTNVGFTALGFQPDFQIWNGDAGIVRIATNNTERLRIDPSGNLLVGTTGAGGSEGINLTRPANTATYIRQLKSTQAECTWGFKSSTDTNMYIGSGSSAVGTYGVYLTNTGNSWNAVSDERMKTIVEPIENAAEKVSTLRSVIGYYNHDEKQIRRPFLIAQDVQAVLPEAVNIQDEETGTLGMSYTDTIPLLVAAIKELKALSDTQAQTIEALTARIAALESNNGTF